MTHLTRRTLLPASLVSASILLLTTLAAAAPLPPHPRLILTPARVAAINAYLSSANADALFFHNGTLAEAEWVLSQKPFPPQKGPTGTPNDRVILQRLYALGVMYRLTGNASWSARAVPDILNAVAADQWDENGTATLNTGEMLHAVGVAFDWNYGTLTTQERETVVAGVLRLGLNNIRAALGPAPPSWAGAFVATGSNWNTVILGGAIIACLAIGEEPTTPAWVLGELLPAALTGIRSSLATWGDDGGWMEGNNYAGEGVEGARITCKLKCISHGSDTPLVSLYSTLYYPHLPEALLYTHHTK